MRVITATTKTIYDKIEALRNFIGLLNTENNANIKRSMEALVEWRNGLFEEYPFEADSVTLLLLLLMADAPIELIRGCVDLLRSDVNASDKEGNTAMSILLDFGFRKKMTQYQREVFIALWIRGLNPNAPVYGDAAFKSGPNPQRTALHLAARSTVGSAVGADSEQCGVRCGGEFGERCEYARDLIHQLLEMGASINATDRAGRTPLDHAGCVHIAQAIKKAGGVGGKK